MSVPAPPAAAEPYAQLAGLPEGGLYRDDASARVAPIDAITLRLTDLWA